jgi:hypothetical protein
MNLENYIINDKSLVENSKIKTPIYMKNLSIDKDKGEIKFECAKTRRDIKYTHANIYLSQYQNPETNTYFNKYFNILNDGVENITENKLVNNSTDNNSIKSYTRDTNLTVNNTQPHFNIKSKISSHNVEKSFSDKIKLDKETGNSIYLLFFIFIIIMGVYFKKDFN